MPMKPPSPCVARGCPAYAVYRGRCRRHAQAVEQARGSAAVRLYDAEWRRESKAWLQEPGHEVCVYCGRRSNAVDHRIPHHGDRAWFWDRSNWIPSCVPCNSRKCANEEGGFGR